MNRRDNDRRSGHSSERDDNRRREQSGMDRRWSNERDQQNARADHRMADRSDRFSGPGDRTSHEYGWNNERNWNDERNDWERQDDGVRSASSDYGQDRSRP